MEYDPHKGKRIANTLFGEELTLQEAQARLKQLAAEVKASATRTKGIILRIQGTPDFTKSPRKKNSGGRK